MFAPALGGLMHYSPSDKYCVYLSLGFLLEKVFVRDGGEASEARNLNSKSERAETPNLFCMKGATTDDRFERRMYSVTRAAQLVGMSPSTLNTWARGYRYTRQGLEVSQGPVITALTASGDDRTIPFVGLVEATVVQAFRQTGLPMQRIRRALAILAQEGHLSHALASRQLYTDGARVLYDYARSEEDRQLGLLTVVDTGQRVFHEVIRNYLERITFEDLWATSLILPITERKLLIVAPKVAAGDPLFLNGGAPLSAVHSRFVAGEPIKTIAADFDVPADDIKEALHAIWPRQAAA